MATELEATDTRLEELERTLEVIRQEAEVAHVLLGLSAALSEVSSVEETLSKAVRMVRELLGADQCFAATWDPLNERFWIEADAGFTADELSVLHELAESGGFPFMLTALRERAPVLIPDVDADPRISLDEARRRGMAGYIAIPLLRWGGEFGGLGVQFKQKRPFTPKDEALARGISRQVGAALATARQFNLLDGLRRFGERVASKLRLGQVVEEVARGAKDLVSGDASWIYFVDSDRTLVAASGVDVAGSVPERLARVDLHEDPWRSFIVDDRVVIEDLRVQVPEARHSGVLVAVRGSRADLIGGIFVLFRRAMTLGEEELGALRVLAAQSAMAIENAQRFERQRSVARSLQEGLLASDMPDLHGCSVAAVYEPAGGEMDIGGDFYDVFDLPDGRFVLVVGDVSGKGADAAAQTAMAKYMLRAFAMRDPSPSSVLFHLNNALAKAFSEDRFITLVYALFDPETRSFALGRGGHPAPLIYRAAEGEVEPTETTGPLLGAFEDQNFHHETYEMAHGDVFLAYTDGLVEARRGDKLYGRAAVVDSLRNRAPRLSPAELARRIYQDAEAFGTITDDTIVFVLKCAPEGSP